MIRFLLVLLALVSALLAFIFQEIVLFVASGGLLMVSVVLVLLQVREQSKRRNRLKLPNDLTPEDELRARGVLEIRPKARPQANTIAYAPPELSAVGVGQITPVDEDLFGIQETDSKQVIVADDREKLVTEEKEIAEEPADPGIPWAFVAADVTDGLDEIFSQKAAPEPELTGDAHIGPVPDEMAETPGPKIDTLEEEIGLPKLEELSFEEPMDIGEPEPSDVEDEVELSSTDEGDSTLATASEEHVPEEITAETPKEEVEASTGTVDSEDVGTTTPGRPSRRSPLHRRVEVDAHLPALQTSLGAHTICLIDVDTDCSTYRLRSIVSSGLVDNAGTEYPFSGFFLSDLLAETTVLDIGPDGLSLADLRFHRNRVNLAQVVAAPVMKDGLPAAFLVACFEHTVEASCKRAVTRAAAFFGSLYALQADHPSRGESPLVRAKRKPPSLRLVKSNPKSSQSRIIAEEMTKARGSSNPMAFALVCLDKGDEIARADEMTMGEVEEWMRRCLEQITPDGRIEYLGELGYGIIQLRDVSDVEGWVRRAQQVFRTQHGPVDAQPIVGVAMLSDVHRDPEDLQADAVRALRAAYETGDSTILVG